MATGRKMTVADHARAALEFLEHSDEEFARGDEKQGSEKLWGAAAHSVMAVAMQRGWRYSKHNAKVAAVNRLAEEYGEPTLVSNFFAAEQFHSNFYHEHMEDDVIERGRPIIAQFVHRILEILEQEAASGVT